jgi:biopolymer transport protein ExbB
MMSFYKVLFIIAVALSSKLNSAEDRAASQVIEAQIETSQGQGFYAAIFGVGMWPLWICSFLLVAFIFERYRGLSKKKLLDKAMTEAFIDAVQDQDMDRAKRIVDASNTVVAKAWSQGLEEFRMGGVSLQTALTDEAVLAFKPLKRNLQAISTIGVISPLFGLLGTVSGMIITFSQIAATGGADKAQLADGIGLALLTTCGGLLVSIPAIVGGRYFNRKLIQVAEEVESDIRRVSYRYNASLHKAAC